MLQAGIEPLNAIDETPDFFPLPELVEGLFDVYLKENGLTEDPHHIKVANMFSAAAEHSSSQELLESIYSSNSPLFEGITSADEHAALSKAMNSYFHTIAVAQESRRLALDSQMQQRTLRWLRAQRFQKQLWPDQALNLNQADFAEYIPFDAHKPGGWAELFFPTIDHLGQKRQPLLNSVEEVIRALENAPPVEKIVTQHPTNVFPVELNQIRADWAKATAEVLLHEGQANNPAFIEALTRFHNGKRTPEGNFTIFDEIEQSHHKILNLLEGRGTMIAELMELVELRFGPDSITPDQRLRLAKSIKATLGDWAAYDRDGNDTVHTEHSLIKPIKQRMIMVNYYLEKLTAIRGTESSPHYNLFAEEVARLTDTLQDLNALQDKVMASRNGADLILTVDQFNAYSDHLNAIAQVHLNGTYAEYAKVLEGKVDTTYRTHHNDPVLSKKLLHLASNLANEALAGAHNESRQNSHFHDDAVAGLMRFIPADAVISVPASPARNTAAFNFNDWQNYAGASEEQKNEILNHLITLQPGLLRTAKNSLIEYVRKQGIDTNDRDYNNGDAILQQIKKAYHTLPTYGLAQQPGNHDLYRRITMAETGKVGDMLNIIALQVAVQPANEARARWLELAPLFEQINSIRGCTDILNQALSFDSFKKLLVKVKGIFIVMIGHSDGAKEAGRIGHVGLLGNLYYSAKNILQYAGRTITWTEKALKNGVITEVRSHAAALMLRIYHGRSHTDIKRCGGGVSASELRTAYDQIALAQGSDGPNLLNSPANIADTFTQEIVRTVKNQMRPLPSEKLNCINERICNAAASTADSYHQGYFLKDGILGRMLARIYRDVAKFANIASRGAARKTSQPEVAPTDSLQEIDLDGVKARAITTSTAIYYARGGDSWAKADLFESQFAADLRSNTSLQQAIHTEMSTQGMTSLAVGDLTNGEHVSAPLAQALYKISPEWRRIMDQTGQSMALTDLSFGAFRKEWYAQKGMQMDLLTDADNHAMFAQYATAARLVSASHGKGFPEGIDSTTPASAELCGKWHDYLRSVVLPQEDRNYLEVRSRFGFAFYDRLSYLGEKTGMDADIVRNLKKWAHNTLNNFISPRFDVSKRGTITLFNLCKNKQASPALDAPRRPIKERLHAALFTLGAKT